MMADDLKPIVTRTSHVVGGLSLQLKTKCEAHYEARSIYALLHTLSLANKHICSAFSLVIDRDALVPARDWYTAMDAVDDETATFSQTLFDVWGRLRYDITDNPKRRGIGVWGHELGKGMILLIETVHVDPEYRRRGIGTWLLNHILSHPDIAILHRHISDPRIHDLFNGSGSYAKSHTASCSFAFAWPTSYGRIDDLERKAQEHDTTVAAFRKMGFRRVATTNFFAYALRDAGHPSHRLLAADDDEAVEISTQADVDAPPVPPSLLTRPSPGDSTASAITLYPLHAAIVREPEDLVLKMLGELAAAGEHAYIRVKDSCGYTPLHTAAAKNKPRVVAKLLANSARDDLYELEVTGHTPLQVLERSMESGRMFYHIFHSPFPGFSERAVIAKAALLEGVGKTLTPLDLARIKWGCTCGDCAGGWLSPVMRYRMIVHGEVPSDMIPESLDMVTLMAPRERLTEDALDQISQSEYIPTAIRAAGVFSSYLRGYAALFGAVARLVARSTVPVPDAVVGEAMANAEFFQRQAVAHYLAHGGRVEHVLNAILYAAEEQGPSGDGETDRVHGDGFVGLPLCDNDEDYEMLYANLRVPTQFRGPLSGMFFSRRSEDVGRRFTGEEAEDDEDEGDDDEEDDEDGEDEDGEEDEDEEDEEDD